jgi:flagellar FliJ protein
MTRSKKLAPVVKHVDNNEQTDLQAVAYSQHQLNRQQAQLEQLIQYRFEYIQRRDSGQSCSAVMFSEYNRFIAQLDVTIEQQRVVVEAARHEVEFKTRKWKLSRSRSDAMHKMVDRLNQHEARQEAKSEQKFLDEIALRSRFKSQ